MNIPGIPEADYTISVVSPESKGSPATKAYGSFTSYVDAIRVYNPLGSSAPGFYKDEFELGASYRQVKELVNNASTGSVNAAYNLEFDANAEKPVSVKGANSDDPNNEVYIRKNSSVAFNVGGSFTGVHLSVKSPTGESVTVKVNGNTVGTINHTTELYYDITQYVGTNGAVSVTCAASSGDPILSLVNVKLVTNADSNVVPAPVITVDSALIDYVEAINFGISGDADHNGSVNIADAIAVLRCVMGMIELDSYGTYCADIDRDGKIAVVDAISILLSSLNLK